MNNEIIKEASERMMKWVNFAHSIEVTSIDIGVFATFSRDFNRCENTGLYTDHDKKMNRFQDDYRTVILCGFKYDYKKLVEVLPIEIKKIQMKKKMDRIKEDFV